MNHPPSATPSDRRCRARGRDRIRAGRSPDRGRQAAGQERPAPGARAGPVTSRPMACSVTCARSSASPNTDGNTRAARHPGYDASVEYVAGRLESAGFDVTPARVRLRVHRRPLEFEQTSPEAITYVVSEDFSAAEFTPTPTASGLVQGVDLVCRRPRAELVEWVRAGGLRRLHAGNIALLQRGTCNYTVKADNAQDAGRSGWCCSTKASPAAPKSLAPTGELPGLTIPVIFTTFDVGNASPPAPT